MTFARAPATGAFASAEKRTGIVAVLAAMLSASNVTPAGSPVAARARSPPKSARVALTRIACRFPFGTATTAGGVPRWSDSFAVLSVSAATTGLISTR